MKNWLTSLAVAAAFAAGAAQAQDNVVNTTDINSALIQTDESYTIATVVKVDGIAWFDRMRDGVQQFGADTGQDTYMVGPSSADAAAQVQLVENLIAQGVDAIAVVPFSVEALEPVLSRARDRGIVVISHEASNIQNVDFDIEAFDNLAYGAKLMDELAVQMGEGGEYVATVGSLTSKSQNEWIDGAIARQEEAYPNMSLAMDRIETYDNADTDYTRLKEALAANPEISGIVGGPMPTSAGAGRLIAESGLQGQLHFAGTGLPSVAGNYLENGDISYIQFWDPAVAGYAMNMLAVAVLEGRSAEIGAGTDLGLEGYRDLKVAGEDRQNVLYGSGWVGVTVENMDQYDF